MDPKTELSLLLKDLLRQFKLAAASDDCWTRAGIEDYCDKMSPLWRQLDLPIGIALRPVEGVSAHYVELRNPHTGRFQVQVVGIRQGAAVLSSLPLAIEAWIDYLDALPESPRPSGRPNPFLRRKRQQARNEPLPSEAPALAKKCECTTASGGPTDASVIGLHRSSKAPGDGNRIAGYEPHDTESKQGQTLAELEADTPPLDTATVDWVEATQKNTEILKIKISSLRRYRTSSGEGRSLGPYFGVDKFGRRWRKDPSRTEDSNVFYWRPSLPEA